MKHGHVLKIYDFFDIWNVFIVQAGARALGDILNF
jgi:hypothetical protein